MDTQPAPGFIQTVLHVITDVAYSVAERAGETRTQQLARAQAASEAIMAFMPRDAIEAVLASHCLMFHELMVDSVRDALLGSDATARHATRAGIVAMDKAFGNNLSRLRDYRRRRDDGLRAEPEAVKVGLEDPAQSAVPMPESAARSRTDAERPGSGTDAERPGPVLNRAARRAAKLRLHAARRAASAQSITSRPRSAPAPEAAARKIGPLTPPPDAGRSRDPLSHEAIAAGANPEAMAALAAGDPERFARALGIALPGQARLATAPEGNPLNVGAANRRSQCVASSGSLV